MNKLPWVVPKVNIAVWPALFDDLAQDELRQKLLQRGLPEGHVEELLRDRDDCLDCRTIIAHYLREFDG